MRIEHLKYFCEVARTKSINEAARNLFMTQPALTSALNVLEKELGFQLLIRSHSGVALTANGERLRSDCEQIFSITSQWPLLAEKEKHAHETIHIVANPAAYHAIITPLVLELDSYYKGLNVFTYEVKNQAIPSYLEDNDYSIGIISVLPKDETAFRQKVKDNQWKIDLLLEDTCQILMSTKNPLAQQEYLTLSDLSYLNLAMYPEKDDPIAAPLFKQYFHYGTLFHLSNLENILQVVVENKAVATMPGRMLSQNSYVRDGKIKPMEIADYQQPLNYYLLYRKKNLKSECYKNVIRLTKQVLLQELQIN